VMWSVFLWKTIHVFCNHTFCDVKYFYFLLSKYSLIFGKGPLGGSRWKLLELTSVSRFLAYCTRPHDWRIRGARGKVKPRWGKKSEYEPDLQKNLMCKGENCKYSALCYLHFHLCSIVQCKCLWRGRLVRTYLSTDLSTLLSQDFWLISAWNPNCLIV
jgi:hypothetical protein